MTLKRTHLVQRLTRPWKSDSILGGKDDPFAFGGGYKNGGLSDEAMSLLRPCFGFDYMGSAEYEFGAVPEALQMTARLAEDNNLLAWEITIDLTTVPKGWRKEDKKPTGEATVYVLGDRRLEPETTERIRWIAREGADNDHPEYGAHGRTIQFQEMAQLGAKLRNDTYEYQGEVRDLYDRLEGWLELENGFLFFTDEQMWARTAAIFGVETGVQIEGDD